MAVGDVVVIQEVLTVWIVLILTLVTNVERTGSGFESWRDLINFVANLQVFISSGVEVNAFLIGKVVV